MQLKSRLLLVAAAVLLVPTYWLPLWSIRIVAPQYREGLGMYIGLRDIWGHQPHDIQNINILNHYIGMKPIDPAVVDVLTIMPWVVGFLAVAALLVALVPRRAAIAGWLVAFVALGTAGLAEFWSWNYDYGHNLDPMAPIKVPGMTYQPPLVGTKQLLNMATSSFPSWGTLFIALAFAAGAWALVLAWRARPAGPTPAAGEGQARLATAAAALLLLAALPACQAPQAEATASLDAPHLREAYDDGEFEAFVPGGACAYCDGEIDTARFGAQLTTTAGETHRFMSAECMAGFVAEGRVAPDDIRSMQVVDYAHGARLIDARDAFYVRMDFERSPGGLGVAAVRTEKIAASLHYFQGGERLDWDGVTALVRREWGR